MNLIHRLFGGESDTVVLCPRCERAMEGHDDAACQRKMSRRFFFGIAAGAAVVSLAPIPNLLGDFIECCPNVGVLGNVTQVDLFLAQIEKVRHKLPKIFESNNQIVGLIKIPGSVRPISRGDFRIPIRSYNNAKYASNFRYPA